MPMAGFGSRFDKEGYELPKPLIEVSMAPMFYQAINDLPKSEFDFFVIRKKMPNFNLLNKEIKNRIKNYDVLTLDKQTDGQARTVAICANNIKQKINYIDEIITIGTCDSGVIFDHKKFNEIIKNENSDVIVWGIKTIQMHKKIPICMVGLTKKMA